MKILLAVLTHHQAEYAPRIASAILSQSVSPDGVLVLVDRPGSEEIVKVREAFSAVPGCRVRIVIDEPEYLGRPQMDPSVEQFCSGELRNVATRYAMANGFDGVVFIDGDCVPGRLLIESHASVMGGHDGPVATVGRRNEVKYLFRDQREIFPSGMAEIAGMNPSSAHPIPIFRSAAYRVTEEPYFVDSGVVWTCNFGLSRAAMETLVGINRELFGRDEVFSSDFVGTWGGEDGYIGFECLYGGVPVISLPERDAGVLHIEHERPLAKYDHAKFLGYLDDKRIELMHLLQAFGRGTCGYEIRTYAEIIGDREWINVNQG